MTRTALARRAPIRRVRRKRPLRKLLWAEFARLIRRRDGGCMVQQTVRDRFGKCGGSLAASHIYPKGEYPLMELYPPNVKMLCYRHHIHWWHKNPTEATDWWRESLRDPEVVAMLDALRQNSLSRKGMTETDHRAEWALHGLT